MRKYLFMLDIYKSKIEMPYKKAYFSNINKKQPLLTKILDNKNCKLKKEQKLKFLVRSNFEIIIMNTHVE